MWQQHVCLINRRFSPPSQHSGSIFFWKWWKSLYRSKRPCSFFFPKGYCYLISIAQCNNAQFTLVIVDGCKGLWYLHKTRWRIRNCKHGKIFLTWDNDWSMRSLDYLALGRLWMKPVDMIETFALNRSESLGWLMANLALLNRKTSFVRDAFYGLTHF